MKKLFVPLLAMFMAFASTASQALITATDLTATGTDITTQGNTIAVWAVPIIGAIMAITIGIKLFKRFANKVQANMKRAAIIYRAAFVALFFLSSFDVMAVACNIASESTSPTLSEAALLCEADRAALSCVDGVDLACAFRPGGDGYDFTNTLVVGNDTYWIPHIYYGEPDPVVADCTADVIGHMFIPWDGNFYSSDWPTTDSQGCPIQTTFVEAVAVNPDGSRVLAITYITTGASALPSPDTGTATTDAPVNPVAPSTTPTYESTSTQGPTTTETLPDGTTIETTTSQQTSTEGSYIKK